jgi:1-acyl-sn-glycerol-3-phosphate acyltransferase
MFVRGWRAARLALHLVAGALTVLLRYPFATPARRQALRRRWAHRLLAIAGVELQPCGEALAPGCLRVANHVSWLDVFVIDALAPAAFVAKADVRDWPLLGWLAARNDTVFLRRGSRGDARLINAEIGEILASGGDVALFPEGTTTDGSHVLHFHAALLQPAIAARRPVQPLALRYVDPSGTRCDAPVFVGDMSLASCVANILAAPRIIARVEIFAALPTGADADRRSLAAVARARIVGAVEAAARGSAHMR